MATIRKPNEVARFAKYDSIQIGDTISFPKSMNLIKSGVISQIKGLNQYHKEVWTTNGGRFIVDSNNSNAYELTKAGN